MGANCARVRSAQAYSNNRRAPNALVTRILVMSLNDPQWGKRGGGSGGGSGPPDLDEIWRNVNRRMSELFGRKTGGDQPTENGGGTPGRGLPMGGVAILVALVAAVWLASGFYIVDEGRRGVVTRFG